ncbi:MAG TPA: TonB-dependent receptor [Thermoanaerobaculia bacterium]|nr:TonB-dependent receptor [Thermoanaerobaculia bacterium]
MRELSSKVLLVLAGVLGGATSAGAQSTEPVYRESVLVTAAAEQEEAEKLAVSVSVLGPEELEARQVTSLAEALVTVPSAQAGTLGVPGQQTSVFLRGSESDQTLLLWNGVALNSPYFGAVNWQFVPTEGVERIEVVRGPASALWGGRALGGVVQVLSGARDGGKVRLEGGEDGYFRAGLAWGRDLGAVRVDVDAASRRGDGAFENSFFDSDDVAARLAWEIAPGATLGLLAHWDDSETGIPFSGRTPTPRREIAWQERTIAVPVSLERGPWSLSAHLSHVDSDYAFRDPDDPFGFVASDTAAEADRLRTVATWRGGERWRLSFGAEAEQVEATDSSTFGVNLDAADQSTWAAFGELGASVGPVEVQVGARRDDNSEFGGETSLRAGLVWPARENLRLRASWGEAFRPPTLGELFFPGSGNPALEPERGESFEVGVEWRWDRWRADVAAFELEQEDLIDFDLAAFTFANVARARSRGVEASLSFTGERLAARLEGTWLEAENLDTGEALLRRAEEAASLYLSWRRERLRITATTRFVGRRPDVDPETFARAENGSYTRFDLALSWALRARLTPFARVENLADRDYEEALGFPAPGRTWVGGVALGF